MTHNSCSVESEWAEEKHEESLLSFWRITSYFWILLPSILSVDSLSVWLDQTIPSSTLSNSENILPILFFSLAVIPNALSLSHFLSHSLVIHFLSPPRAARPWYDTNYFILEHTAQPTLILYILTLTRTLYVPVPIIFVLFLCNFETF